MNNKSALSLRDFWTVKVLNVHKPQSFEAGVASLQEFVNNGFGNFILETVIYNEIFVRHIGHTRLPRLSIFAVACLHCYDVSGIISSPVKQKDIILLGKLCIYRNNMCPLYKMQSSPKT